jgi:competence protein ComGD
MAMFRNNKPMENSNGFTMVEMLVVLSAFIVLSFSSLFLFFPQDELLEQELFFSQFKTDLLYAQQYAISHQEKITVHIVPESKLYYIIGEEYGKGYLINRSYSSQIQIESPLVKFSYMPDGNIDKFGPIYIKIGAKRYVFMIQIGKGRFYVTEE